MSFQLPTQRKAVAARPRWSGVAFLVEAMLLLVFLMASLAVCTQLFAEASSRAGESEALTEAVVAGTAVAERFAANPSGVEHQSREGDMLVVCDSRIDQRVSGAMHYATISVYAIGDGSASEAVEGEPLYVIDTAHYEAGVN